MLVISWDIAAMHARSFIDQSMQESAESERLNCVMRFYLGSLGVPTWVIARSAVCLCHKIIIIIYTAHLWCQNKFFAVYPAEEPSSSDKISLITCYFINVPSLLCTVCRVQACGFDLDYLISYFPDKVVNYPKYHLSARMPRWNSECSVLLFYLKSHCYAVCCEDRMRHATI